jgi:hypothetical protein
MSSPARTARSASSSLGLGIPEVDQNTIAHVLRNEPAEALHALGNTLLIGRDNPRRSSGSMRAERAVEPTRSENITVTWRRSARSSRGALGAVDAVATSSEGALPLAEVLRAAMVSSSLRRCPSAATPSSFRSSAVRPGRTVSSISFSRKAASYFPRPRLTQSCGEDPGRMSRRSGT